MKKCLGCMEEMEDNLTVCPLCGYVEGTEPKEIYHIIPGTVLHQKYIVGKVLGYGGFGITYIGWDYTLNRKVAIKEFLPSDFSTRMPGETVVTVYNGEATAQFEAGLERFVEEAQRLAKFNHVPGIVDIYDTFIENNTGYIVMQCLEGDTVKELLAKNGVMPYESAKLIMVEILKTLAVVHKEGIIHRDISPDNVFITNDNEIKLLDFGAARYASTYHSKSLSVILKPGYAPEEQYRSHGNQGPWSDVYAASATLYKMITGITIEESMERTVKDDVKSPMELGVVIPEGANNAIMNALNIHAEMRTQSADDFIRELTSDDVERIIDNPLKSDVGRIPLWLKITAASVLSVAVVFASLIMTGVLDIAGIFHTGPVADASTRVPYVINQMMGEGEKKLNGDGFAMQISDQAYDEFAEKDIIKSQTPDSGMLGTNCEEKDDKGRPVVFVTVSGGHAPVVVPDVMGFNLKKAKKVLEGLGFKIKTEEEYSQTYEEGTVLLQDIVDIEYAYGSTVILTVSKGEMKVDASKKHKMPNFVGMDYDEAAKKLMAIGMYAEKKEEPSSKKENQVLKQSEKKGEEYPEGTTVVLTVSSNTIVVPNVVYKEEAAAVRLIQAAGAKVTVTYEQNAQVKKGNVISQSVTGKSKYGVNVKLVVSTGFDEANKTVQKYPTSKTGSGSSGGKNEKVNKSKGTEETENKKPSTNNNGKKPSSGKDDSKERKIETMKESAAKVDKYISDIGTVEYTSACKGKIDKAQNAYNALDSETKGYVKKLSTLNAASSKYNDLKKKAEDDERKEEERIAKYKENASKVDNAIANIGTVEYNSACKNRIQSAQNAFNALDSESRKYVTRASELSAAVTKYQELETEAKNSYVVIPELTGMRVGTNYGGAYNQLVRSYPEFSTLKINFHTVTNSSYSDGQIAETDPPAGSVITKSGTLDVYISKR